MGPLSGPVTLLVARLELVHELSEGLDTFHRHGIVDRCPHAANGPVALEADKPLCGPLLE